MLALADRWVWDFWLAHDGERHHLFFLYAPKSLGPEHRRHRHARVGHASSADLVSWTVHEEALGPRGPGFFDESATWTGCVVRDAGQWVMFYTGSRFLHDEPDHANVETVGRAVSPDLFTWTADPQVLLEADPRWYEKLGDSSWPEEAWRDPWVHPVSDGWNMLITARSRPGEGFGDDDAGVLGRAWSPDLVRWEIREPFTRPGSGFVHLEVPQIASVQGREFLLFSCPASGLSHERQAAGVRGGVWSVPVGHPVEDASLLLEERWYSARVVDHEGVAVLLAFENRGADGEFPGVLADPFGLKIGADGHLRIAST